MDKHMQTEACVDTQTPMHMHAHTERQTDTYTCTCMHPHTQRKRYAIVVCDVYSLLCLKLLTLLMTHYHCPNPRCMVLHYLSVLAASHSNMWREEAQCMEGEAGTNGGYKTSEKDIHALQKLQGKDQEGGQERNGKTAFRCSVCMCRMYRTVHAR